MFNATEDEFGQQASQWLVDNFLFKFAHIPLGYLVKITEELNSSTAQWILRVLSDIGKVYIKFLVMESMH